MSAASPIEALERAIRLNWAAKRNLPDCSCWGNAPQAVDEELFRVLERPVWDPAMRQAELMEAIRLHREAKQATPECTCWSTPARKADLDLYGALDALLESWHGTGQRAHH